MNSKNKKIILALVVVCIIGSIWYLEAKKPHHDPSSVQDIIVTDASQNTASTTVATQTSTTTSQSSTDSSTPVSNRDGIRQVKALQFPRAKEFVDPQGFINTQPFKLSQVVGNKVVLIDFWTYSCINCLRTIPYLNAWYQKYKDYGLEIVGVHTPEFDFEKNYDNVSKAVASLGIKYPVVLDSNNGTWDAYQNSYWPREYLIDIDGFIVHDHIGEGSYAETEQAIQKALQERQQALGLHQTIPTTITNPNDVIALDASQVKSPETYFGAARNQYLANGSQGTVGTQSLSFPSSFQSNVLYLDGSWNFQNEYAETTSQSTKILFKYNAKNVYIVASSKAGVKIKVLRDGQPLGAVAGSDVQSDGTVYIKDNRLYKLINGSDYGEHTLEIDVEGAGLDAFTFTFG